MSKYNIVTGWKRGGTSAVMLALRQAGIPIVGFKYPIFIKGETGRMEAGLFTSLKTEEIDNPTGFWEIPSIAKNGGLQKSHKDYGIDGDLIKVPFDTLFLSDPEFIDKVIIVLRNPRKVLASRMKKATIENTNVWIKSTCVKMLSNAENAINWLKENNKQYIVVSYESLSDNLDAVCDFLERGDSILGAEAINSKLDRVKPITDNCNELTKVEKFYTNLLKKL